MSKPICTTPGCDRDARARGYCKRHYQQAARQGKIEGPSCQVDGCQTRAVARGYCDRHYQALIIAPAPKPDCSMPGCAKPSKTYGLCSMHAERYRRHGDPEHTTYAQDDYDYILRAISRVATADPAECWEYQGTTDTSHRYGRLGHLYAHRLAYTYWHPNTGNIAEGLVVRHACDNPPCCNPHHLSLGTPLDNTRDMQERGRATVGEAIHNAKLTEDDVRAIRTDPRPNTTIAADYNVKASVISNVKRRKTWKHVA